MKALQTKSHEFPHLKKKDGNIISPLCGGVGRVGTREAEESPPATYLHNTCIYSEYINLSTVLKGKSRKEKKSAQGTIPVNRVMRKIFQFRPG
jgi:hypothetical protein